MRARPSVPFLPSTPIKLWCRVIHRRKWKRGERPGPCQKQGGQNKRETREASVKRGGGGVVPSDTLQGNLISEVGGDGFPLERKIGMNT